MSDLWNGLFNSRTALKSFAVVSGICLAFEGSVPAQAQQACSTTAVPGWLPRTHPSLDDQRSITDVLSSYAWTIDDRDPTSFVDLFLKEASSSYELCNVGGQVFRLTFGQQDPNKDLETEMTSITKYLKDHNLQTRHLVTNTLFDAAEDGKTVKTKSTVLVTLQASNLEAPELDYSADVRATLAKDGDGNWKFQSLTVYADNAAIVAKKR